MSGFKLMLRIKKQLRALEAFQCRRVVWSQWIEYDFSKITLRML